MPVPAHTQVSVWPDTATNHISAMCVTQQALLNAKFMKKLLQWLYFNWLLVTLAATMLGKALGIWSAWWILTPVGVWALLTIIAIVPCLGFLRFITWPLVRKQMEMVLDRVNSPLLGYPLLVWMILEGKKIYIERGDMAFRRAFIERGDKVGEALTDVIKNLAKAKA